MLNRAVKKEKKDKSTTATTAAVTTTSTTSSSAATPAATTSPGKARSWQQKKTRSGPPRQGANNGKFLMGGSSRSSCGSVGASSTMHGKIECLKDEESRTKNKKCSDNGPGSSVPLSSAPMLFDSLGDTKGGHRHHQALTPGNKVIKAVWRKKDNDSTNERTRGSVGPEETPTRGPTRSSPTMAGVFSGLDHTQQDKKEVQGKDNGLSSFGRDDGDLVDGCGDFNCDRPGFINSVEDEEETKETKENDHAEFNRLSPPPVHDTCKGWRYVGPYVDDYHKDDSTEIEENPCKWGYKERGARAFLLDSIATRWSGEVDGAPSVLASNGMRYVGPYFDNYHKHGLSGIQADPGAWGDSESRARPLSRYYLDGLAAGYGYY